MKINNISISIKNILDRILALIGIIAISPILFITAFIIKIESEGPIIFKQDRVGKDGKIFKVYKFRSMIENAQYIGAGLYFEGEDDPRITKSGKFIRKTSIDELPQLFNVLKGEMSLVGPRPLLKITIDEMTDRQRRRLLMKPGMTGLAQINGRNELSIKERIENDLEYIENYSLILDVKIILRTIGVVLLRKGIRMDQSKSDVEKI
ncbi:MAG: sugar transferase [Paraclostridium sordellii]